jgi:hypothetical protein
MKTKWIRASAMEDGTFNWDGLYENVALEREFICSSINCVGQTKKAQTINT